MPAWRSAQYVTATPPAPAAENSTVAAKPDIVICHDAPMSSRWRAGSLGSSPPSTPRNSDV
jgi:hypothetical protein